MLGSQAGSLCASSFGVCCFQHVWVHGFCVHDVLRRLLESERALCFSGEEFCMMVSELWLVVVKRSGFLVIMRLVVYLTVTLCLVKVDLPAILVAYIRAHR